MKLQIIAQIHQYFKTYILLKTGEYTYKGHVYSFRQDISTFKCNYLQNMIKYLIVLLGRNLVITLIIRNIEILKCKRCSL